MCILIFSIYCNVLIPILITLLLFNSSSFNAYLYLFIWWFIFLQLFIHHLLNI